MSDIIVEVSDRVMSITLNRAEKKNAITNAMYGDIAAALGRASASSDVNVVLINGAGADFCAGNDIGMFAEASSKGGDLSGSHVRAFLIALSTLAKPIVAAVQGRAIGIGVTMLLHCDLVYVAEDAQLRTPFIDLGLVPEAGSARLLPARIGHVRSFALFALNETLSGVRAAEWGVANAALPAHQVQDAARAAAQALATKPPAAVAATKRLMRDAPAIAEALAEDHSAFIERLASPEAAAAFAAFAARKPR